MPLTKAQKAEYAELERRVENFAFDRFTYGMWNNETRADSYNGVDIFAYCMSGHTWCMGAFPGGEYYLIWRGL